MNRSELRRAMRERKKELRLAMARLRSATRQRLEKDPRVRRERRRRMVRRIGGLAVLLLLATLINCRCEALPIVPEQKTAAIEPEKSPPKKALAPAPKKKPFELRMNTKSRAGYQGETRAPPSWLDDFRLQVAARSPRLSECFTGSERPGALRWTSAVNAQSGTVSDHLIEPQGEGPGLQFDQIKCLQNVLANPPYKLAAKQAASLPERVGIVIEF